MVFVSIRKLKKILSLLEEDSCNTGSLSGSVTGDKFQDFIWKCGNANAVNFIKSKLNIND